VWSAVLWNDMMKFDLHKMLGVSYVVGELSASEEGLCCLELVESLF
jgi:hypothetical protein